MSNDPRPVQVIFATGQDFLVDGPPTNNVYFDGPEGPIYPSKYNLAIDRLTDDIYYCVNDTPEEQVWMQIATVPVS